MPKDKLFNDRGSLLILSVWVISFLTIFAAYIGLNIRGKISLLSRLENRSQLHYLASAGIKNGIAILKDDLTRNQGYSAASKQYRHNNPRDFIPVNLGGGNFSNFYYDENYFDGIDQKKYGVIDEERKLNINLAGKVDLKRLFETVLEIDVSDAEGLAEAIIDWREIGTSAATGFYSDEYYQNLKFPYKPKDYDFELIEELRLIQGMDQERFEALVPFVTIYGNGQVNINTAKKEVLMAIGLDEAVAEKIIMVRRGNDGLENTIDDFIFHKTYDIASTVGAFVEINEGEMRQIDALNSGGKIATSSNYYLITSHAEIARVNLSMTAFCVYNGHKNRIEYWREKY